MLMDIHATQPEHSQDMPGISPWLSRYMPGDSLFVSPHNAIMAHGSALSALGGEHIAQQARELLRDARTRGSDQPILLGLIPFSPAHPSRLLIPECYERLPGLHHSLDPEAAHTAALHSAIVAQRTLPTATEYEDHVRRALAMMASSPILRKLVLARTLELELETAPDLRTILGRLLQSNPSGYTYALPLEDGESIDPAMFFGASPELLIRRQGRQVTANPLAGTAARHPNPQEDQRRAQALLASAKDQHEHAIVIEDVARRLRPFCNRLHIPDTPSLVCTSTLWHLSTHIEGELADTQTSSLDLAIAMHPTPAVCGQPTELARTRIEQLEPFDRGYFAGVAGWCDVQGDGEWAVAIRCAHYRARKLVLYAGAGIVPDSDPSLERIETGNKLRTILNALGLDASITTD